MCSFYAHRSQKCQMTLLTWLSIFAHSGSTCVKAVLRMLMKLSPDHFQAIRMNLWLSLRLCHKSGRNCYHKNLIFGLWNILGRSFACIIEPLIEIPLFPTFVWKNFWFVVHEFSSWKLGNCSLQYLNNLLFWKKQDFFSTLCFGKGKQKTIFFFE